MNVQNNLCAENFRDNGAEYKKIWHVVYMDHPVSPFQELHRCLNKTQDEKAKIGNHVEEAVSASIT